MFPPISDDSERSALRAGSAPRVLAGTLVAATCIMTALSAEPLVPEGVQYSPAGNPIGDQLAPHLAIRANGGALVWHDNLTDGDGLGVSIRRLSGQLAGLSSLRVNQDGVGDQQNPQVAILGDGSSLIVWQSGLRGAQRVLGRVLAANGQFAGPEFPISVGGTNHRNPSLAVGGDGSVLVVWSAEGVDGSMSGVQARRLDAAGHPVGDAQLLNQETRYHQRDPVVTTTGDGNFVVVWISEQQRFENSVDVYARRVDVQGQPVGDEFLLNISSRPCTTPSVTGLEGAGFMAVWAEHQDADSRYLWDVVGRVWGQHSAVGSVFPINQRRINVQYFPRLASSEGQVLVVYESGGGDGRGTGVVGRWIGIDGNPSGDEFLVNSKAAGSQMNATVAADNNGRLIAVWSTFGGIGKGMDLAAQRYARPVAALPAPAAPFLFAASASRIQATWAEVQGLNVVGYDVYLNGETAPVRTTQAMYSVTSLAPGTTVSLRVAYVLADGRRSPSSEAAIATSWGEDDNADGLPDDWQEQFFGDDPERWPPPSEDSDADGVNNRTEFLAGTDPTSSSSVLRVRLVGTAQGPLLVWDTRPGAIYQVQWTTDLRDWNDLGSPRLAAGTTDSVPAGETPANAYYRITLLR